MQFFSLCVIYFFGSFLLFFDLYRYVTREDKYLLSREEKKNVSLCSRLTCFLVRRQRRALSTVGDGGFWAHTCSDAGACLACERKQVLLDASVVSCAFVNAHRTGGDVCAHAMTLCVAAAAAAPYVGHRLYGTCISCRCRWCWWCCLCVCTCEFRETCALYISYI